MGINGVKLFQTSRSYQKRHTRHLNINNSQQGKNFVSRFWWPTTNMMWTTGVMQFTQLLRWSLGTQGMRTHCSQKQTENELLVLGLHEVYFPFVICCFRKNNNKNKNVNLFGYSVELQTVIGTALLSRKKIKKNTVTSKIMLNGYTTKNLRGVANCPLLIFLCYARFCS